MKINFTNFINKPYHLRFTSRQITAGLLIAVCICLLDPVLNLIPDSKYFVRPVPENVKPNSVVINGFENLQQHRIFEKPSTPIDKRILMLGACQISSLHWDYSAAGFDPSGRSSLPYLMEKEFHKDLRTSNLYVYNLGMEGTGYLEALYFLLSTLEQPNIRLVVLSISQEGDTHIPDDSNTRFAAYSQFLPKMEKLLKMYHEKYPEITELDEYYQYVKNHRWTIAGREAEKKGAAVEVTLKDNGSSSFIKNQLTRAITFLEYNSLCRSLKFHSQTLSENTGGLLTRTKEWLGIQSAQKNTDENLQPAEWYIKNFKPRSYTVARRPFARYIKRDELAVRTMAKLLARKKIELWIHNPADLAVQMDSLVNDRWWVPLNKSVRDLPNVKTIDMSRLPIKNGIDVAGRVAPTYYGSLKTMNAFIPYILEWNKND
jgi:hypothetical protein